MGTTASKRKQEELTTAIQNGWVNGVREVLASLSRARTSQAADDPEVKALKALDLNAPLSNGHTPLQFAAFHGRTDIVRLLLEFDQHLLGIEPNALGTQKRTALHYASASRKAKCVAELLAHGADPCIAADDDGSTALDVARKVGCQRTVRAIEDTVVLWQGWVDHYEKKMLLIPSWKVKWLVIVRDRRPNTGPGAQRAGSSRPCSCCGAVQPLPRSVAWFPCERCGMVIPVPASLQMAVYELAPGATDDDDVDITVGGAVVQPLPQDPSQIVLSDSIGGMANAVSSSRSFSMSVKVLSVEGQQRAEHCFRLDSEANRARLVDVLKDPQRAAMEAEAASMALASLSKANWNCAHCGYPHEGANAAMVACSACGAPRGLPAASPSLLGASPSAVVAAAMPEASAPPLSPGGSRVYEADVLDYGAYEPLAPPMEVPPSPKIESPSNGVCVKCSVFSDPCGAPKAAGTSRMRPNFCPGGTKPSSQTTSPDRAAAPHAETRPVEGFPITDNASAATALAAMPTPSPAQAIMSVGPSPLDKMLPRPGERDPPLPLAHGSPVPARSPEAARAVPRQESHATSQSQATTSTTGAAPRPSGAGATDRLRSATGSFQTIAPASRLSSMASTTSSAHQEAPPPPPADTIPPMPQQAPANAAEQRRSMSSARPAPAAEAAARRPANAGARSESTVSTFTHAARGAHTGPDQKSRPSAGAPPRAVPAHRSAPLPPPAAPSPFGDE